MSGRVVLNIFAFWYICWHSIAKLQPQSDHGPQRGGGGGGTLILFDTCVGSGHFLFKFLNYIIFYGVGGSKMLIFLGV